MDTDEEAAEAEEYTGNDDVDEHDEDLDNHNRFNSYKRPSKVPSPWRPLCTRAYIPLLTVATVTVLDCTRLLVVLSFGLHAVYIVFTLG